MSIISDAWLGLDSKTRAFWNNTARNYTELGGSGLDVTGDMSYRSNGFGLFTSNAKYRLSLLGNYGDFSPIWILNPAFSSINPTLTRDQFGFLELTDIVQDYNNAPYLYENRLLKARRLGNPGTTFSRRRWYAAHPI